MRQAVGLVEHPLHSSLTVLPIKYCKQHVWPADAVHARDWNSSKLGYPNQVEEILDEIATFVRIDSQRKEFWQAIPSPADLLMGLSAFTSCIVATVASAKTRPCAMSRPMPTKANDGRRLPPHGNEADRQPKSATCQILPGWPIEGRFCHLRPWSGSC